MNLQTRRMFIGLLLFAVTIFTLQDAVSSLFSLDRAFESTWTTVLLVIRVCIGLALMYTSVDLIRGSISKKEDQGQNYNVNINAPNSDTEQNG